ncbi:MAG: hypothetical protein Q9192_007826, partial [Flavoplaca navasiana]
MVKQVGYYPLKGCFNAIVNGTKTSPLLAATATALPTSLDVESCVGFCATNGYAVAGMEDGKKCACEQKLATAAEELALGECNVVCPGNKREFCGAEGKVLAYVFDEQSVDQDGKPQTFGLKNEATIKPSGTDAAELSRTINGIVGERWPVLDQVLQHEISIFFKNSLPVDADGEEVFEETLPELQGMNSDSELGSLFEEGTDVGTTPGSGTTLGHDVSPIDETKISYLYESKIDVEEAATNGEWAMQQEPSTDGSTVGGFPLQAGMNTDDVPERSTMELQQTFEQGLTDTNNFAEFWALADQAAACNGTTRTEHTLQADAGTSTEDGPEQILIQPDQLPKGDHTAKVDFAEVCQSLDQAMWDDSNTERTLQADANDGEVEEDFECSPQEPAQRDQIYPQNANGAWPIPLEATKNGNHSDMEELVQTSANVKRIGDVLDGALQQPAGQGHNNALNTEGARPPTHQMPCYGSTTELKRPSAAGLDVDEEGLQELQPIASLDHTDMISTKKYWPLLHHEVWYGNYTEVEQLLQAGTDVREVDDEGEIALHHAAWRGFNNIAISLLERGADPNSRDGKGQTPLHHAASNKSKGA